MLALDLFCCGGGSTTGLQRAGFRVVGADHKRQREYRGDDFLERDLSTAEAIRAVIDEVRPDFISSSPPCQAFSAATPTRSRGNHANLIPACREAITGSGIPGWIENVSGAPLAGPIRLCGTMFHATWQLKRHRHFDLIDWATFEPEHRWCVYGPREDVTWTDPLGVTATTAGSGSRRVAVAVAVAGHGPPDAAQAAQYRRERGGDGRRSLVTVAGDSSTGNIPGGVAYARRKDRIGVFGRGLDGPGQMYGQNRPGPECIRWRTAMGWLDGPRSRYCLAQAVPPAYAEWLARRFLETRRA